jgi:hypothetical protein
VTPSSTAGRFVVHVIETVRCLRCLQAGYRAIKWLEHIPGSGWNQLHLDLEPWSSRFDSFRSTGLVHVPDEEHWLVIANIGPGKIEINFK